MGGKSFKDMPPSPQMGESHHLQIDTEFQSQRPWSSRRTQGLGLVAGGNLGLRGSQEGIVAGNVN